MPIKIKPIGSIHSIYNNTQNAGRQPSIDGAKGKLIIHDEYVAGLEGLEEFSHIIVLYHFHLQASVQLQAKPCFDPKRKHGIFASRYPTRPNHIGISMLTLKRIEGNILYCNDVDVVNNTPLLDIKPYVKQFDEMKNPKCGWYDSIDWSLQKSRADY